MPGFIRQRPGSRPKRRSLPVLKMKGYSLSMHSEGLHIVGKLRPSKRLAFLLTTALYQEYRFPKLRASIVEALKVFKGDPEIIRLLTNMVKAENELEGVRVNAAFALGEVAPRGDKQAINLLNQFSKSVTSYHVAARKAKKRRNEVMGFGNSVGNKLAKERTEREALLLTNILQLDPVAEVRAMAAGKLGEFRKDYFHQRVPYNLERITEVLSRATADKTEAEDVRRIAKYTLEKIGFKE